MAKPTVEGYAVVLEAGALANGGRLVPDERSLVLVPSRGPVEVVLELNRPSAAGDGTPTATGAQIERIRVRRSRMPRGGYRLWLACPGCNRRVGLLYDGGASGAVRCRRCLGLAYASQSERVDPFLRGVRRLERIEERLADPQVGMYPARQLMRRAEALIERLRGSAHADPVARRRARLQSAIDRLDKAQQPRRPRGRPRKQPPAEVR